MKKILKVRLSKLREMMREQRKFNWDDTTKTYQRSADAIKKVADIESDEKIEHAPTDKENDATNLEAVLEFIYANTNNQQRVLEQAIDKAIVEFAQVNGMDIRDVHTALDELKHMEISSVDDLDMVTAYLRNQLELI